MWIVLPVSSGGVEADNSIGVEGAMALASALERNSTLLHLDISSESPMPLTRILSYVCENVVM
jgi:hypothetical protein